MFTILSLALCVMELCKGKEDAYAASILRLANGILILFYPGLLITFIQRITVFKTPGELLILFFLIIFGNDVFAYVFGMWLGKNNRGWASASPNKSIAGLVGGILSAVVIGGLFCSSCRRCRCAFPAKAIVLSVPCDRRQYRRSIESRLNDLQR